MEKQPIHVHSHAARENHAFSDSARQAVYQAIFSRRDVRGQFLSDPIDESIISRLLLAAHYAPSVGFMQPWSFLVIRSIETRRKIHDLFLTANDEAGKLFHGEKGELYRRLKLEGILESSLNICITCDRDRAGEVVIGRTHQREMDLYSTVCSVQNLWLAARAEGIGVGWVSIFHEDKLKSILNIPESIVPVAYLCLGYVTHFCDKPELLSVNWRSRLKASDLVHFDSWGSEKRDQTLIAHLDLLQEKADALGTEGF